MGVQLPTTINLSLKKSTDKTLDSLFLEMPEEYRLNPGRYSDSKFDMEIVYPRPNNETSQYSYHRIWQTGEPYSVPIRAMWGAFPYSYRIISSPVGWSIGEWLVLDGAGRLVADDNYGTLTNTNPSAGTHNIVVGVWDAIGTYKTVTLSINVGNYGFFAAPVATGSGDGSSADNCMALNDAHLAGTGVSPSRQKILFLRGGTYNWSGDFVINDNKSISIVNYRNEEAILNSVTLKAQIQMNTNDIFVKISTNNWGDKATFYTPSNLINRQVVWRSKIYNSYGLAGEALNEAAWFVESTGNSTKRQHFMFSEIEFINCHEVCAFDFYSTKFLAERQIWTTSHSTLEEPVWFPKASCEYDMRWLRYDNVTVTSSDNNQGVLMLYNSETLSRVKGHVRFNFVRANSSVTCCIWNGADNAGNNYAAEGYDDRNTYIGGKVIARDFGGDQIDFTNDVMQNSEGGVLSSSQGYTVVGSNSIGTTGIVDINGILNNTARRGLDGADIYGN